MDDLDDLETVDCYDDEDDDGVGWEETAAHDHAAARTALDRHAARFGLEAVNTLCVKALAQTAELAKAGSRIAAVPDELARFMQADDAYWIHLACGLWYNATDICGATRRDTLAGVDEWCLLPPHDLDQVHGFTEIRSDGRQYLRPSPIAF